MFKVIKNDSGGMHIRIIRREELLVKKEKIVIEEKPTMRLYGVNRKKGDTEEESEIENNLSKHICEICNQEFDRIVGLKIHKMKKHR